MNAGYQIGEAKRMTQLRKKTLRGMGWVKSTGLAGLLAVAFVASLVLTPTGALAHNQDGPESIADLAERLLDAVVNISTSQTVTASQGVPRPQVPEGSPFEEFFDEFFDRNNRNGGQDRPRRVQSLGSGFVISAQEGIIVTNNHVIAEADEITANFADGTKLIAEIVGRDPKTDLAVLKVNPEGAKLVEVPFGDSESMRVGDWVMAIGNPFGLGGTVTVGIVSARNRDINAGPYDNFIQTDAAINRGNSGGPLFNKNGEVIGINTAIISPTGGSVGVGFAIPTTTAVPVIRQLRQYGETRRGWLGVRIQEVTDEIADGLGLEKAEGALVAGVTEESPAEDAGIEAGDVILKFAGQTVETMRELPRMVANSPIGEAVDVEVFRKGELVELQVTLGRLDESEAEVAALTKEQEELAEELESVNILGLTLRSLTPALREEYKIDEKVNGLVVVEVAPNSNAEEKRIQVGDVVEEIAQEIVETPRAAEDRFNLLVSDGRRTALLLVTNPSGDKRFVAIRVEEEENEPLEEPENDGETSQ